MRSPTLDLKEDLVQWLQAFLTTTERAGYVVGVSGGIDSAVASLVAYEACQKAGRSFIPLCLPIAVNGKQDGRDMRRFFSAYGIDALLFDLTDIFDAFMRSMPGIDDPFTIVTVKHRIRMDVVYTYAKCNNLLVISTVNKIEYSTGYFPKLAGIGDVLPLANLQKRQIRALAAVYQVPDELATRKASGCIHGRTAEDEWGFTEDEGDTMVDHLEEPQGMSSIGSAKVERFCAMRESTHHKRVFPPIFVPRTHT